MPAGVIDTGAGAIYRVISGVSEAVTEIKPGEGLAIQGSGTVSLVDFAGDPGPVTESADGTFFGKFLARNVLNNKEVRIKHFHINSDGIYEEDDALVRYYICDGLKNNGKGRWSLSLKDEMSKLDKDKNQFPAPTGGTIRTAINNSVTTIPVDLTTDWLTDPVTGAPFVMSIGYTIKVGDELMKVTAVTDNQGTATTLTVATRALGITFSSLLSLNAADSHAQDDDVQICYTADAANIARVLQDVVHTAEIIVGDYGTDEGTITLIVGDMVEVETGHSAGGTVGNVYKSITATGSTDLTAEDYSVGAAWEDLGIKRASIAEWKAEIAEWHSSDVINTIYHEPTSTDKIIKEILNDFLLDSWFDNEAREIKLSAISVWKETGPTIEQGKGITRDTFIAAPQPNKRFSRAFIYWNKPNKVENDDIKNFRSLAINTNSRPEAAGLYGEPKTKEFENSHRIGLTAADLLTQRYVARFAMTPYLYLWETEERFLNFKTGDIGTLITSERQNFDGTNKEERAQILSVQPVFSIKEGRKYKVKALTFEPALASGAEFTISANSQDIDLHTLAGAPSGVVTITYLIDGATIGSTTGAAIVAGSFASGSVITIILINSAELFGLGGRGGRGGNSELDLEQEAPFATIINNEAGVAGTAGGIVYDAQGVDTNIYLGGTVGTHTALGVLKAPGGGGGGESGQGTASPAEAIGGDGAGGGAGSSSGVLGAGGVATDPISLGTTTDGAAGTAGTTTGGAAGGSGAGAGGNYGAAGSAGDGSGGAAGKGIIKGGATVNVYTSGNSSRFVNGGGDTPDATS
jgi:hypothetical protein